MKNRKIDKMESLKLVCKIYFKNYTMVYIGETSQKLKKKKRIKKHDDGRICESTRKILNMNQQGTL